MWVRVPPPPPEISQQGAGFLSRPKWCRTCPSSGRRSAAFPFTSSLGFSRLSYLILQLTRASGDVPSLLHTSQLAASGGLLWMVFVPGLVAGLTVGGGWRRGLVSSFLGAAAVGAILSAFIVFALGLGRALEMLGGFSPLFAGLTAASMAAGAGGAALRARWGPQLETVWKADQQRLWGGPTPPTRRPAGGRVAPRSTRLEPAISHRRSSAAPGVRVGGGFGLRCCRCRCHHPAARPKSFATGDFHLFIARMA